MKITRQKRPDRVICKWKNYEILLDEQNDVRIMNHDSILYEETYIPLSEIPNLIKALEEVSK